MTGWVSPVRLFHSLLSTGFKRRTNTTPLSSYEPFGGFVRTISMSKTYTPELAPEVLNLLHDYADRFRYLYRHAPQFSWSGIYLRGLLEDGERKSIEPMAGRVPLPLELSHIK